MIFLCSTSFVIDLWSPWAAVNCVYLTVILFVLWFLPRKHVLLVTGFVTVLMVTAFLLQYHGGSWLRDASHHILVLIIVWQSALLGLRHSSALPDSDEERFSLAAEEAVAALICKPNSLIYSGNKGFEKLSGYTADEMAGRFLHTILVSDGKDLVRDILQRVHAGEDRLDGQTVMHRKNHPPLEVCWLVSARRSVPGTLTSFVVYLRDSTEEHKVRDELRQQKGMRMADRQRFIDVLDFKERMRAVSEPQVLIALIVSEVARILQAEKCSFMSLDPLSGQLKIKGYKGVDPRIVESVFLTKGDPIAGWIADKGEDILVKDIESDPRFARSNRPTYVTKSFMAVLVRDKENILGVISVADHEGGRAFEEFDFKIFSLLARQLGPVLGNAELLQEISQLASVPLQIDIGHYRGFKEALLYESQRSQRYNTRFCVFIIRVNRFQLYVDAFGEYQAQALTKNLKEYFQQNLRDVDLLFQLAGDEFAVISPHLTGDEGQSVVSRIHNSTKHVSSHRDVTLMVGVFSSPQKMPPDDLLGRFNQLYKESGAPDENSVVFLSPV